MGVFTSVAEDEGRRIPATAYEHGERRGIGVLRGIARGDADSAVVVSAIYGEDPDFPIVQQRKINQLENKFTNFVSMQVKQSTGTYSIFKQFSTNNFLTDSSSVRSSTKHKVNRDSKICLRSKTTLSLKTAFNVPAQEKAHLHK